MNEVINSPLLLYSLVHWVCYYMGIVPSRFALPWVSIYPTMGRILTTPAIRYRVGRYLPYPFGHSLLICFAISSGSGR